MSFLFFSFPKFRFPSPLSLVKKKKRTDHRRPLVQQPELAVLGFPVSRVAEDSACSVVLS